MPVVGAFDSNVEMAVVDSMARPTLHRHRNLDFVLAVEADLVIVLVSHLVGLDMLWRQ